MYQRQQIGGDIADNKDADTLMVIANRNVNRGQVLTLFPIHALGIRNKSDKSDGPEFIEYNHEEDEKLFVKEIESAIRLNIPLDTEEPAYSIFGKNKPIELFAMYLPGKEIVPGWLGGVIKTASEGQQANCIALPLPGAAPLCVVVSTKDIQEGDEIVQEMRPTECSIWSELKSILVKEYRRNISTLSIQIEMALETAYVLGSQANSRGIDHLGPFHQINLDYPGLKQIHCNPDIYAVENFLTPGECDRIVAKARPHLSPCLVYKEEGDENSVQDPWRTSTNANLPRAEVPSVVDKISSLGCCSIEQLEILQVLNYKKGQQFKPHTDGFSGPYSACGFEQSSRLATVFCYLNDVSEGGSTYFPVIDLDIKPKKGTAIIHFPADMNMREDKWTLHQGKPAIDEKWLLTTWVWKSKRTDEAYAEWKLPPLSRDII
jgi:prolyl 4-hydroxylase